MERRESRDAFGEPTSPVLASGMLRRLGVRSGLAFLVWLTTASLAIAEPAELPQVSAAPPAAIQLSETLSPEEPVLPVVATPVVDEIVVAAPAIPPNLEELLFVPGARRDSWRPQTDDEVIADAVALGTNPDLEPRNPFRKRSRDLFRTERPVTIGRQELLMRLRLKAKASEAVSVEFRF